MRLKSVGGHFTAAQLNTVRQVADRYGKGYVHLTSRQGIEIPYIRLKDIDEVKKVLKEGGVEVGFCGPRVRTITACQGAATCPSGLIDTVKLANEFDRRYGGRELPHKFKFGFTGCHNNCLKAEENDMGIKGGVEPRWGSYHHDLSKHGDNGCNLAFADGHVESIKSGVKYAELADQEAQHYGYCAWYPYGGTGHSHTWMAKDGVSVQFTYSR